MRSAARSTSSRRASSTIRTDASSPRRADYGYYDLGGQNPWGGSVAWGNVFNDRFGILLSASYSDREFNSHNVQGGDPWVQRRKPATWCPTSS